MRALVRLCRFVEALFDVSRRRLAIAPVTGAAGLKN
jgi:hypothetical protein